MHEKKSEVQIGKESSDISSDFNPIPSSYLHHPPKQVIHHHQQQHPSWPLPPHSPQQQQKYHPQELSLESNVRSLIGTSPPSRGRAPRDSTRLPLNRSPTGGHF
ncbi:hypothetical protein SAY87_011148 [Trapa incisa]|uniref:Uncharacterized protein n=1 Tax=Trapa incisa TaxID=236973 RepID=A0AAN7GFN7_9MYRT|nr:hypothetical protein SAY87_011148 [Trapa incisa]